MSVNVKNPDYKSRAELKESTCLRGMETGNSTKLGNHSLKTLTVLLFLAMVPCAFQSARKKARDAFETDRKRQLFSGP
jgi:hypothetical protein